MILKNLGFLKKSLCSLTPFVPAQGFAIRTTQATILKKTEQFPQLTREAIKKMNEERDTEKKMRELQEAERKAREEKFLSGKFNDRNPANLVKLKVNVLDAYKQTNETLPTSQALPELNLSKPYVVIKQPRAPKIIAQGIRRKIPCRLKKMLPITRNIAGLHIYDAMNYLLGLHRKAALYIRYTLQMVRRHAVEKGLEEERLFVSEVIVGKYRRTRGIRYHGRGRTGVMTHDSVQLTIKLEEKPVEEIYRNLIQGKFSPTFAYIMRKNLLNNDADYETIRKYQYVLTAKGRQQRKLMFKRRVLARYLELRVYRKHTLI